MYKFIFRMPIGSRWLLVGLAPQHRGYISFRMCFMRHYGGVFFILRFGRLEVYLSELPF
jgi:hypothetical protein